MTLAWGAYHAWEPVTFTSAICQFLAIWAGLVIMSGALWQDPVQSASSAPSSKEASPGIALREHSAVGLTEGNEKGAETNPSASRARNLKKNPQVECSNESNVVAGTGFEPVTSGL